MLNSLKSLARPPYRFARKTLWLARRKGIIDRYLSSTATPKLQVGTGFNGLDGWLNGDILPRRRDYIYLDATQPLPFADNSFAFIYTEHMIEHIGYHAAQDFVRECYRILRPGGVLRISTPNLAALVSMYAAPPTPLVDGYIDFLTRRLQPPALNTRKAFAINNYFYNWGHAFLFDQETLATLLEAVGFADLSWHRPQESAHPELRRLEKHGTLIGDEEFNAWQSMTVDARKPATVPLQTAAFDA
jgi:predicted SAM-dependent methyltransferase